MTGLVRKATLLTAVGLVVAAAAWAGVPNEANSTVPISIKVSGHANPPDPSGTAIYIIRDLNNTPVPNAPVVLDFSLCTDVLLSQNVTGAGMTIDCGTKRVTGTTNGLGELAVNVVGGGNGNGPPRAVNACLQVTVGGEAFTNISVSTMDRDGVGGVGAGDLSLLIFDFVNNPTAGRSDLDGSGAVGAGDLSQLIAIFISGASALSGSPYCP